MSNSEQQPPERVWIPRTLAESLSDEQLAQTDVEYVRVQPASEPAWLAEIERRCIPKLITAYREALAQRQEWLNWADSLTGNQHYLASKMRAEISAKLAESRSGSKEMNNE